MPPPLALRRLRRQTARRRVAPVALALLLAACTPTYNWRETRPAGPMVALLPCKPEVRSRSVPLAGAPASLTVAACEAGGLHWGLAVADVGDPRRVGPALGALEASLAANLGAPARGLGPVAVDGQTPHPQARQARIDGRDPAGAPVSARSWVWARGTWVAQASVLARAQATPAQQEAIDAFAAGLRVAR